MNQKEKKLLTIFAIMLVFSVLVQGVPFAIKSYTSDVDAIEELKDKRKRLKKLLTRTDYWKKEYDKNNHKEKQLKALLYVGQSPDLIAGRVQGKLKKLTEVSGIKVDSMSLPEFKHYEGWLVITQSMTFKASSDSLMKFLQGIAKAQPQLIVTDLQIRSYRNSLRCTVKVIGFNRNIESESSEGA
jgi:hypothetical protein